MNHRLFNILEIMFTIFPIVNNRILFCSFSGQFNDNPLYVYKILSNNSNLELIWVISKKSQEPLLPKNIKIVKLHSIKHAYYSRTAKVIIDNGAGYKNVMKTHFNFKSIYKLYKRKRQLNISTWHGTPLKKIGVFIPGVRCKYFFSSSDIMIAGNEYTKRVLSESFMFSVPVLITGTPRNDVLFNNNYRIKHSLRSKLCISENARIILYAPTYRENINNSGYMQLNNIDTEKLIASLSSKFGGNWKFAFRIHNMELSFKEYSEYVKKFEKKGVINFNKIEDMAECLLISDALITDFSGALYDFALTKKPIFLFAMDKNEYINSERGLNIDINQIPFDFSNNFQELLHSIETFDDNIFKIRINKLLDQIGNHEDGKASKRLHSMIVNFYKHKNKKTYIEEITT